MKVIDRLLKINIFAVGYLLLLAKAGLAQQLGSTLSNLSTIAQAQITPDNTVNTTVNQNGNVTEITGGRTEGGNLFHSFQDFSVPTGNEASFRNAETIENIFSRVTGGNISNIDGAIRANGSANLFLINPAGIIFGENARLDVGGSFISSTADSILFPNNIEFSASDTQSQPTLTVNAPIGLGFRDNSGDIVNRANSFDDNGTPDNPIDDRAIGLRVGNNRTISLIGANISFEGGFATTNGGRIEVGSVGENSNVSLTPVESGWDLGYEDVANFRDISLTAFSRIGVFSDNGETSGDIQVRGNNISLSQGSQIGVFSAVGQAGNVSVLAAESIQIDGNGIEIDAIASASGIFSVIKDRASGENSAITIETPTLSLSNNGTISAINSDSMGRGIDIFIAASEISLDGTIEFDIDADIPATTGIFAQTLLEGIGDGGNITIETAKLTANNGAQISTETFGSGDAGDLIINASESIELTGTVSNNRTPSSLLASVRQTANATGEGGDITLSTPRLIVRDGAQIASVSQSQANGGNIAINAKESILLIGTAPTTELDIGRTGITVSAAPSFDVNSKESIATTGNAGSLNINTKELNIERGALINASTSSLGDAGNATIDVDNLTISDGGEINAGSFLEDNAVDNVLGTGGNLNITAAESVKIIGTADINGELKTSSISTIAEGTGDAGNLFLTADNLTISEGGEIDASATGNEAAGNLTVDAETVDLDRGNIRAITTAGEGGNIRLTVAKNITLRNESQISAQAVGDANGGNIDIDANFIIGFSSQPEGSDIIAKADRGTGGNIDITADSLFGIAQDEAVGSNGTNDIDASSDFGLDGNVIVRVLDIKSIQEMTELPKSLVEGKQTTIQACQNRSTNGTNTLTIQGKGGIERQPVEPLDSEIITIEQYEDIEPQQSRSHQTRSFQTSKGSIVPAQGVAVTKSGQVILTSYQTNKEASKNSDGFNNCV